MQKSKQSDWEVLYNIIIFILCIRASSGALGLQETNKLILYFIAHYFMAKAGKTPANNVNNQFIMEMVSQYGNHIQAAVYCLQMAKQDCAEIEHQLEQLLINKSK